MVLNYDYYKSIWVINPSLSLEKFLEDAGVEKGYALIMFTRIYYSIYSELIDVKIEYEKYYSFEYDSLENYLYKKINLEKKDIKKLNKAVRKNPNSRIFRKDNQFNHDYSISELITSKEMYKSIIKILNPKK